jgi:hypothetical protein
VHALAEAIRRNAKGRLEAARDLAAELDRHAAELGLSDDAERQATSRVLTALLDRLAATTDDTQTVRVLAAADLRKDNAFFYAHLDGAERLTTALRQVNWAVLGDLAATDGDLERALISGLRLAAEREDAIALLRERARQPTPPPVPIIDVPPVVLPDPTAVVVDRDPVSLPPQPGNRVRARDVPAFVNKICDEAEDHPDAEFEISWRIVEP